MDIYPIVNSINSLESFFTVAMFIAFQLFLSLLLLSKSINREGRMWTDILVKISSFVLVYATYQLGNSFVVHNLVDRNLVAEPTKFWGNFLGYSQFAFIFLLSVRSLLKEKNNAKAKRT